MVHIFQRVIVVFNLNINSFQKVTLFFISLQAKNFENTKMHQSGANYFYVILKNSHLNTNSYELNWRLKKSLPNVQCSHYPTQLDQSSVQDSYLLRYKRTENKKTSIFFYNTPNLIILQLSYSVKELII